MRTRPLSPPRLLAVSVRLVLFVGVLIPSLSCSSKHGKLYEKWEVSNQRFRVRVQAFEENSQWLTGGYILFESSPVAKEDWHKIMEFRHDDPVPIPRQNIRFIGDDVGYVFLGWKYAVTTDAGRTWTEWSCEKDLPQWLWLCSDYGLIKSVELSSGGLGKMILRPANTAQVVPTFVTEDFGKHWHSGSASPSSKKFAVD